MIMTSPVAALAWEIWRKNRFGFLLLFAFLILCLGLGRVAAHFAAEASQLSAMLPADAPEVIDAQARATDWLGFAGQWSGVLLGLSLLITLAVFAFAESSPLRGFSGVPSRLFTLPVQTGHLVAVPMASGVCFVALLYLAWSGLVLAPILPPDVRMADSYFLLLLPAVLAGFQTLVWTLPGFPRTRVTLLILLVTSVAILSSLPFVDLARWHERKLALMWLYSGSLAAFPFIAWLGVARVRDGQWREWPALTRRDPSPARSWSWGTPRFRFSSRGAILDRVPAQRPPGVVGVGHLDFVRPRIKRDWSFERRPLGIVWPCLLVDPVSGLRLDPGAGTDDMR